MKKLTALLAMLLAGVLTLAACGNDSTSNSSGDTSTAQFNDADVEFAQGMIPHHQQAVEMSQMAETHADSPEVKKLASDIETASTAAPTELDGLDRVFADTRDALRSALLEEEA